MRETVPFGHWPSPLQPEQAAAGKVSLSELASDGSALYWLESRPLEAGRVVLVRAEGQVLSDHSPPGVSIRSRVHEYGGGAMTLVPGHANGAFAYVDQSDQRVWFSEGPPGPESGAAPRALSDLEPEGEAWHHGGLSASADGDWVLAVREIRPGDAAPPVRQVVALDTRAGNGGTSVVLEGHDFFGTPRLHPSGDRVAVVVWRHPDMPWDSSEVAVTPITILGDPASGLRRLATAGPTWTVAGGPEESVGQPWWRPDGTLRFISDRGGWWQPYTHSGTPDGGDAVRLSDRAAEFHGPDWVLGQATMADGPDGTLVARMTSDGRDSLVAWPTTATGPAPPTPLAQPCVTISTLCAHGDGIAFIGATPDAPPTVWVLALGVDTEPTACRPPPDTAVDPRNVSRGEPFWLTGHSGRAIHGALYRPVLHGTVGPSDARPPLVIWCHGGPTSAAVTGFDMALQFFTTRGFAVACVDYAGSTGYGRAHRCALWGQWGVADAEDCRDAARHLAGHGQVDPQRMAIRGGSAGGLTALNALAGSAEFRACVSWYGVTDLLALAATTHDFEAHYTDRLIGPLPGAQELYEARSPVCRAAAIEGSVLLLQGTDDVVVPPAQAERLRQAMVAAGRTCVVRLFDGEGHGFRRADTLIECLRAELEFYRTELDL